MNIKIIINTPKSVKHLASLQMYYCKLCNFKCNLDQKENHLNSKQHKDKNEDKKQFCGVCNIKVSQMEKHKKTKGHVKLEKLSSDLRSKDLSVAKSKDLSVAISESKNEFKNESKNESKIESKNESKIESKNESKDEDKSTDQKPNYAKPKSIDFKSRKSIKKLKKYAKLKSLDFKSIKNTHKLKHITIQFNTKGSRKSKI